MPQKARGDVSPGTGMPAAPHLVLRGRAGVAPPPQPPRAPAPGALRAICGGWVGCCRLLALEQALPPAGPASSRTLSSAEATNSKIHRPARAARSAPVSSPDNPPPSPAPPHARVMRRGVAPRASLRALLPAACVCLGLLLATTLGTGADEAKASKAKAPAPAFCVGTKPGVCDIVDGGKATAEYAPARKVRGAAAGGWRPTAQRGKRGPRGARGAMPARDGLRARARKAPRGLVRAPEGKIGARVPSASPARGERARNSHPRAVDNSPNSVGRDQLAAVHLDASERRRRPSGLTDPGLLTTLTPYPVPTHHSHTVGGPRGGPRQPRGPWSAPRHAAALRDSQGQCSDARFADGRRHGQDHRPQDQDRLG